MKTPQGVRKINENVLQENRALILTDETKDNYDFTSLPDGTTYIDTNTGNEYVKLKGQTDWVPKNIKQDNTIAIMKDSMVINEVFTVKSIDETNYTFVYTTDTNQQMTGKIDGSGHLVFSLNKGTYLPGRNHLNIKIDGILERTVPDGNLVELNENRFYVTDTLEVGHRLNIEYIKWIRIGNPYPRFYLSNDEPTEAEIGDFWLDEDANLDSDTGSNIDDDFAKEDKISWSRIVDTPNTLEGYGIKSPQYTILGHSHVWKDISDRPSSLPANGGNATTVGGHMAGTGGNNVAVLDELGYLIPSMFPNQFLIKTGAMYVQEERPGNVVEKSLWICTKRDDPHIEIFVNSVWLRLGKS